MKAHLSPDPSHPRALPTLLEAIALWQGTKVRAALVAENTEGASDSSLFREAFHDFGDLHYTLDWIPARAVRRDIAGVGDFSDLRKLLVSKVVR